MEAEQLDLTLGRDQEGVLIRTEGATEIRLEEEREKEKIEK